MILCDVKLFKGSSILCKWTIHGATGRKHAPCRTRYSHEVFRYWSRRFQKHMERKRSGRMTGIPQLDVPDIFVDDDGSDTEAANKSSRRPSTQAASPTHLSVDGKYGQQRVDNAWHAGGGDHPLSFPRSSSSTPSPPGTPSGFGFDLLEAAQGRVSGEMSRPTSSVSPAQARDLLEDSVWLDSIRRSTTTRKSDRGSYRYADLG